MGNKQIGGPIATAAVIIIVLLAVGAGYFYMNRDQMGKGAEPIKTGRPGELSATYNKANGPFPSDTLPNGQKATMGYPGVGKPAGR